MIVQPWCNKGFTHECVLMDYLTLYSLELSESHRFSDGSRGGGA